MAPTTEGAPAFQGMKNRNLAGLGLLESETDPGDVYTREFIDDIFAAGR